MLGPVIGGALYTAGGFGLPFYVLGSFLLCALLLAYFILPPQEGKFSLTQCVRNKIRLLKN